MKASIVLSASFLCLVSLAHLARVLFRIDIVVGGVTIPVWGSLFAFFFVGALAIWLWREGAGMTRTG